MRFSFFAIASILLLTNQFSLAQAPTAVSSSEILHKIKKLNVLGSVLYIAAHPDDENTRLIAYLANGKQYRTAYMSLTRGDGGQNLIGDEQGIDLGLIRTNELMAARRIDGGEQFFSRAYDFGYSKTPEETFRKWDHDKVLSDVVWVIRTFQPDAIIARFPEDGRGGHGHHTASGILAREAFSAAADPTRFPEQLNNGVQVWQAKRMLWNTFNFGGNSTIDSTQFRIDAGGYNPFSGLSYGELAGESRSQHKSQGFGVPRSRGIQNEYFETLEGDKPKNELLDGVDVTWARLPLKLKDQAARDWPKKMTSLVENLVSEFDPEKPYLMVPMLWRLHNEIERNVLPGGWKNEKLKNIEKLVADCMGLFAEALVPSPFIPEKSRVKLSLNIINRSPVNILLTEYQINGDRVIIGKKLGQNENLNFNDTVSLPFTYLQSQPYWLKNGLNNNLFDIQDQLEIGSPVNQPISIKLKLILLDQAPFELTVPLQYKFTDPVKGELYQPAFISPNFLVSTQNDIVLFKKGENTNSKIKILVENLRAVKDKNASVSLKGNSFKDSKVENNLNIESKSQHEVEMNISNYLSDSNIEKDELEISFNYEGTDFNLSQHKISYDHLPTLVRFDQDKIKVLNIDLKISGKKIGYIEGAGDKVPASLSAMGYSVEILKESDLNDANLSRFDAIITGVRAYNVHEYLTNKFDALMKFVQNGGNLIVQYNTSNNIGPVKAKLSPYNFSISRTRVTDEESPVRFALPEHPVFNFPNKITQKDFEGWIQERSIYHGTGNDSHFVSPLVLQDFGEKEESGSLLIAPYGKGNFVYTGLVFFRELPAGVPGAYRLLANIIGLPKN